MNDPTQHDKSPAQLLQHYGMLKQKITQRHYRKDLCTIAITAASTKGQPMNEQQFLINLIFKPNEPSLKLRLEESQLLLAYIGEILAEIEAE